MRLCPRCGGSGMAEDSSDGDHRSIVTSVPAPSVQPSEEECAFADWLDALPAGTVVRVTFDVIDRPATFDAPKESA